MRHDAIVIGAGLFGSIIAKTFQADGLNIFVIDGQHPGSGSAAAGCVMRPSWLTSLGKDYAAAMTLLRTLYGSFTELPFDVGVGTVKCSWVNPDEVLMKLPKRDARKIGEGFVTYEEDGAPCIAFAPLIIVATGVWAEALLPELKGVVSPQWGISFRSVEGKQLDKPFIRPWAPYKQIVGVNFPNQFWVGDGRALITSSAGKCGAWDASVVRCAQATMTDAALLTPTVGARPYTRNKEPALLEQVRPGVWVATGGAKNGTAGAAWAALKLRTMI